MADVLNPYAAPKSQVEDLESGGNTSGMGKGHPLPEGIKGWSWGAFFLNWIWGGFNKTYIGLLALLPYIGIIFAIVVGINGREWAWRNKRWDSVEHFNRVQRKWSVWGICLVLGSVGLVLIALILDATKQH